MRGVHGASYMDSVGIFEFADTLTTESLFKMRECSLFSSLSNLSYSLMVSHVSLDNIANEENAWSQSMLK